MSMLASQGAFLSIVFWSWIGLLISVFVFWRVRHLWLKRSPPLNDRSTYSQRLAKRLRDRQAKRLESQPVSKPRHRR
ncbi:MAG: hypothetical protein EOO23_00955 [Comamonadaceae bacterium]|nr:MAG: hypothetical protein EOO23_00955 [Comamonadaceae bacterium]